MALPFLPEDQISRAFRKLKRKAATRPLQELAEYVENTWITSTTWPPASWSVYLQAVRTNNDVEGWHYGLNRRAQGKSQLPLYMLIMLLHEENRLTSLQIRLVSDKKLCRIQRKTYRGRTYLYSSYNGVLPPSPGGWGVEGHCMCSFIRRGGPCRHVS